MVSPSPEHPLGMALEHTFQSIEQRVREMVSPIRDTGARRAVVRSFCLGHREQTV